MPNAIRIHEQGGPEVMRWESVDLPELGSEEIRIRHTAIGLNFIDTYQRSGLYPLNPPCGLGKEAAGVVEEVGSAVKEFKKGDRVVYVSGTSAYSEVSQIAANLVVPIPDDVEDEVAAASMLKGMTAEYLLRRIGRVQADDVILFHAAAGGTGLIACQWAKALGCTVIGTVSSPAKESLARDNGCDFVINYEQENFLDQVMEITNGKGVRLVYDSVGRDTFEGTIGCLSTRGLFVSFGQSSGPVPPVDLRVFNPKSLFYTRPTLFSYIATRAELLDSSQALFGAIGSGKVKISINQRYPLREVAQAHADLEGRRTTGSTVLIP